MTPTPPKTPEELNAEFVRIASDLGDGIAEAVAQAVAEERAAVVAWLDAREEELNAEGEATDIEGYRKWAFGRASEAAHIACVIERGEHRREED